MYISEQFLEELQDDRYRGPDKVNAPAFIYTILYGTEPKNMLGRTVSHKQKRVSGIQVDENIPNQAIKKLLELREIETRSSCEGESKDKPTFLIFRPKKQDEQYVSRVVNNLNKYRDVSAGYSVGNNGLIRIGVTTKLWYDKNPKEFMRWWLQLPGRIKNSL